MWEKSEELYLSAGAERSEPQASGRPGATETAGRAWRSASCLLDGIPLRAVREAPSGRLAASCVAQCRR